MSSRVRVNREPAAAKDVGGETSDDSDIYEPEERGKGTTRDGDGEDEVGDGDKGEDEMVVDEDDVVDHTKDVAVMRFGPPKVPKGHSGSGQFKSATPVDGNILFLSPLIF